MVTPEEATQTLLSSSTGSYVEYGSYTCVKTFTPHFITKQLPFTLDPVAESMGFEPMGQLSPPDSLANC